MRNLRVLSLHVICVAIPFVAPSVASADVDRPLLPPGQPREFAPMVWLARDEPIYPMLPHAFAFDGIDNDADELVDIADPDEISVEWFDVRCLPSCPGPGLVPKCEDEVRRRQEARRSCWTTVGHPWNETTHPEVRPQARVLSREPSPWVRRRDQLSEPNPEESSFDMVFWLYQYWFYYPFDEGPGAHRDDAEHVSVFLKQTEPPTAPIKAIVAAGHVSDTVNNVLVMGAPGMEVLFPQSIRAHTPVLVELGKHASAPDRDCNGRFDLGLDANLYPQAVWGSRDVWSGNVGQSLKVGNFESWYSYSRSTESLFVEEGWNTDGALESSYLATCEGLDPRVNELLSGFACEAFEARLAELLTKPGICEGPRAELEELLSEPRACGAVKARVETLLPKLVACEELRAELKRLFGPPKDQLYSLFPVTVLEELRALIVQARDPAEVQAFLEQHSDQFWHGLPEPAEWPQLTSEGLAAMQNHWSAGPHLERRDVWEHPSYTNPNNLFRDWLFTKAGIGASSKHEAGNGVLGVSLRLAELRVPRFLRFLGSSQAFHDSRLEAYVHWDGLFGTDNLSGTEGVSFYDAGIDFHSARNRHVGWFLGLTTKHDYVGQWYKRVGLNAGFEFGYPSLPLGFLRRFSLMVEIGANVQLFGRTQEAIEEASQAGDPNAAVPPNVRAFVGLRLTWAPPFRFLRAKHPLSY
jgi:hypothetical protein